MTMSAYDESIGKWIDVDPSLYKPKKIFSANGVPYPLDNYLRLIGRPTTDDIAKVLIHWSK